MALLQQQLREKSAHIRILEVSLCRLSAKLQPSHSLSSGSIQRKNFVHPNRLQFTRYEERVAIRLISVEDSVHHGSFLLVSDCDDLP